MPERSIFDIQQATADQLREVAERQYGATFSPYGPFHMQNQLAHRGEPNLHVNDCVFLSSKEDISDIKRKLYRLGEDIAKFKSQRQLENIGENHG